MYAEADAARLLRVSASTLHYWLEGGERRGRTYQPIIRPEARGGHADVTWAEFVEAGLLRAYRRDAQIPMRELRRFIELLRDSFGVPYPLADRRPYATGRALVLDVQREAGLSGDWWIVSEVSGQLALLPAAADFLRCVVWDDDAATGWRVAGEDSPVRVDPSVRFGRPSVAGIRTEVIWEHYEAGEGEGEIAQSFDLTEDSVRYALAYELTSRTKLAS